MSFHIIPIDKLTSEALTGVIKEFIFREGTDYGENEISYEIKFNQVKDKLLKKLAVIVFDEETETTNILLRDSPLLKNIEKK